MPFTGWTQFDSPARAMAEKMDSSCALTRQTFNTLVLFSSLIGFAASGCDDVNVGRPEDPGTFQLVKLMIQDEDRRGGRGIATDILRDPVAYAAKNMMANECSELEPCKAGELSCAIADG